MSGTAEKKADPQIEVGGSGTAKVQFKDSAGAAVKLVEAHWSGEGSALSVSPDEKDPGTAHLVGVAPGVNTISVIGRGEHGGTCSATVSVKVVQKGAPASGEITIAAKEAPPAAQAPPVHQGQEEPARRR